ncbi:STM3941 family protein [Flavobacterium anhuiense]|uniref:STM3941 family protein n=1 Tax=Flavobacterium anhuiense TaxID=459526 RepID=UPI003D965A02
MNEEINLYRNAKKTRNLILYASTISIVLAMLFLYSIGTFDGIFKTKPAVISGAILLIMLFLTFKSLASVRDKSPLIHMDSNGFSGKTTPLSKAFGRVEWVDVTDIELQKLGGDTLVVVTVDNADKYNGRLSKMMWKMAYDEQNSKLNLMYSASEIDIDAAKLYDLFAKHWKK